METATKNRAKIEILSDRENLARRSLQFFVDSAKKAVETRNVFRAAISGGQTPKRFFELIGREEISRNLPWKRIHLFWVDERIVPPESQYSNYNLAATTFLSKVDIPDANIHRVPTEHSDFRQAARSYEKEIRRVFGLGEEKLPQFDLIVLGMGADGHTGSLFPNSYAPFDTTDLVCVVYLLEDRLNRITLTHPVLSAASKLVVLVSGSEKATILKKVLSSERDEVRFPIHTLWPILDKITWLVDKEAAKLL